MNRNIIIVSKEEKELIGKISSDYQTSKALYSFQFYPHPILIYRWLVENSICGLEFLKFMRNHQGSTLKAYQYIQDRMRAESRSL